jgi:hypothetical protein
LCVIERFECEVVCHEHRDSIWGGGDLQSD